MVERMREFGIVLGGFRDIMVFAGLRCTRESDTRASYVVLRVLNSYENRNERVINCE
jgi:hypothetical protein